MYSYHGYFINFLQVQTQNKKLVDLCVKKYNWYPIDRIPPKTNLTFKKQVSRNEISFTPKYEINYVIFLTRIMKIQNLYPFWRIF